MAKQFYPLGGLRYELFEALLPRMVYKEAGMELHGLLQILQKEKECLVFAMFKELCEESCVSCPYSKGDFQTELFERGGVGVIQMNLPPYNPAISDIVRAYLLFSADVEGTLAARYFLIRRFRNGRFFILYVTPEGRALLGEELTGHELDLDYEHWRVVNVFAKVISKDYGFTHPGYAPAPPSPF